MIQRYLTLAASTALLMLTACGPAPSDGACSSDAECKGDRICQAGACVTPAINTPGNNTPGNNTPGNNTPGNNTPGNNATPATCAQTCQALLMCDPNGDVATCEANCQASLTQAQRNCLVAAPTCPDAEACLASPNPPGNNTPGNNNQGDGGDIGDSCSSDGECKSGRCKTPEGAFEGTCAQNDLGEKCAMTTECVDRICLVRDQNDDFGYCSRECTSGTDCPISFACEELNNGAYKACVRQ